MNPADKNWFYKDIIKAGHSILKHISFEYHVSVKLKFFLNSLIIVLPSLVQFLLFDDPVYLLSFVLCFSFVYSAFLLTRARLILTFPFVLISFIYTAFLVIYKKSLGATSIMALMNTKTEIMGSFTLSPKMVSQVLLFIIIFILYFRFIILKGKDDDKEVLIEKDDRYLPIVVMLATGIFFFFGYSFLVKAYPFSLSYDSSTYLKITNQMKKTAGTSYHFDGKLQAGFRETRSTFILIVGESSRRASWSLYGYHRKTNAFLKKEIEEHPDNFMLFENYITTAQTTFPSLMSIFSVEPSKDFMEIPKHPSFVRILKNTGFKTYFLSTHNNMFENFINADENIIIKAPDDADLIPVLEKMLDDRKVYKKFIVMHLKGSHFAFSDYRYTYKDYIFPSENQVKDRYDNSILHTDQFLANIAKIVLDAQYPICVWYIPDHGETLNDFNDGNYGHGCSGFTRYEIELPSLMFFNDSYLANNPKIGQIIKNKKVIVSHSNVSHTFLGLCGVYPKDYKAKYDISSPNFTYEEPYLIDVDLFPIRYSKAEIQ